ncbi:hypothetical protein U1Q18_022697, partial [Sarracenia purpurea var. burkii]
NVGQYQQPTLGSQLYPGTGNLNYQSGPPGVGSLGPIPSQAGPVPGHKMSQALAPTAASRGFMPVTNSGVQRPAVGPTQPSSPTQPAQMQPAITPAAPPPTVQTVDTSNVPGIMLFLSFLCYIANHGNHLSLYGVMASYILPFPNPT